jgi:hypothetical protein
MLSRYKRAGQAALRLMVEPLGHGHRRNRVQGIVRVVLVLLLLLSGTLHAAPSTPVELADSQRRQLEALGYLQGYAEVPERTGVTKHIVGSSYHGLNLYVAGHSAEARLIDMEGTVRHTWSLPYATACPAQYDQQNWHQRFWRRARVLPNGDLLAIFENQGLVRLDADSHLLWARCDSYHHDLTVDEKGRIWVLRSDRRFHAALNGEHPILDDAVEVLREDGSPIDRISILDALENSSYAPYLHRIDQRRLKKTGDVFHTNSVKVLEDPEALEHPAFRAGNLLISIRELDAVAVLDPRSKTVVWSLSGMWVRQHEALLLRGGTILLFDNLGRRGRSRALEFNPLTQQVLWSFPRDGQIDLYSDCCGSVQRLPNGNTLITETSRGRALEVTREGTVVWEFVNPHRVDAWGEIRIASLWDLVRLDETYFDRLGGR